MIRTLPGWALAVILVGGLGLMVNSAVVVIPLAAAGFLTAMFFTVKHAILSALRARDAEQHE